MISEVDLEDEEEDETPTRLSRLRPSAIRSAQKRRGTRRLRELRSRFLAEGDDTESIDLPAYDTDVPLAISGDDAVAAIQNWASQQLGNLDDLYSEAYRDGYRNFNEQYPQYQTDDPTDDVIGGLADRAMSAHQASIGKMVNELTNLVFAAQGVQALSGWFNKNEKRVDSQAETLAWAAEQHGYKEAGAASGANLQIIWELDEGADHCADCPELADGSPYTEDDGDNPLPSFPGAGDTECQGNCRCSLNYIESTEGTGDAEEAAAQAGQDIAGIAQQFETEEAAKDEAAALIGVGMEDLGAHGLAATLDTIGEAISGLDREVGFALTSSGRVITAHVGTKDSVVFQPAQIKMQRRAALSVHNHPGGQSFSPSDVAFAHAMQFGEMRVYARDYVYTLKPAAGARFDISQGKAIIEYAEHVAHEMLDVYIADAEKAYAEQVAGKWKYGKFLDWPEFWKLESKDFWHNVWDDVAPKFGLEYGRVSQNLEHVLLPKTPYHGPSVIELKPGTDIIHEETPQAAHGIGWLPPNFPQDWDQLKSAKFEHIAGPKGSQEGYWLRDKETAQEYYVKPQVSAERAMNEVGTMRAYEAFGAKPGVDIPFVGLIKDDAGKRYVVSQKMPGVIAHNASWWMSAGGSTAREYAKKLWAADAMLSHYDVAGLALDNLMVNAAGVPVRIEGGAGMKFRAQGAVKPGWNAKQWDEPWTMRAIAHGGSPASTQVAPMFGQIGNVEAAQLLGKLADDFTTEAKVKLEDAWAKLGMPAAQRYENLNVLEARLDMIPKVQEELGLSPTMTKAEPHLPPKPETPGLPQAPTPAAPAIAAKPLHQAFPAEYAEFKKAVPDYAVKVATQDMQASTMTVRREAAFERMAHDYINKEPSLKKLKKAWTFFEGLAPEKLTSILNHAAEAMVKEEKAIYATPKPFSTEGSVVDFAKHQLEAGAMPEDLIDIIGQAIADNSLPYMTPDEVKAILKKNDLVPIKVRDIPDSLQNEVAEMYQDKIDDNFSHSDAILAIANKYNVPYDVAESSVAKFKKAWDAEVSVTGLPPGMFEQAKSMGFIDAYASHSPLFPSDFLDAAHAWQEGTLSPKLTAWFEQHADALGLEKPVQPLPTNPAPTPGPFSFIAPQAGLEPITNEQLDTLWGMYNDQLGIDNVKLGYYDFANSLGKWAAEGSDLKSPLHPWFDAFAPETLKSDQYVTAKLPAPGHYPPISIPETKALPIKALPIVTAKTSGNLYTVWKEDGLNIGLILGHNTTLSVSMAEERSLILQKLIGGMKPDALKDQQIVRVRVGNTPTSYLDTDKVSGKKVVVLTKNFWAMNPEDGRYAFSQALGENVWKTVDAATPAITETLPTGAWLKAYDPNLAFLGSGIATPSAIESQYLLWKAGKLAKGSSWDEALTSWFGKPTTIELPTQGINPLNPFPPGSVKDIAFNATTGSFDTFLDKGGFNPSLVSWELAANKAAWKEAYDLAASVFTDDEIGQAWYAALVDQWKAKGTYSAMQSVPELASWNAYKDKLWAQVKTSALEPPKVYGALDAHAGVYEFGKAGGFGAGDEAKTVTWPAVYKQAVDAGMVDEGIAKSYWDGLKASVAAPNIPSFPTWHEQSWPQVKAIGAPAHEPGLPPHVQQWIDSSWTNQPDKDYVANIWKYIYQGENTFGANMGTSQIEDAIKGWKEKFEKAGMEPGVYAHAGGGVWEQAGAVATSMPETALAWLKSTFGADADQKYVAKIWNHLYLDAPLDLDSIGGAANLAYWKVKFEKAGVASAKAYKSPALKSIAAWNPATDPTAAKFVKTHQALFDKGEIAKAYAPTDYYQPKASKATSYWSRPVSSLKAYFPSYDWDSILGLGSGWKQQPVMSSGYRKKVFAALYSEFQKNPETLSKWPSIKTWFEKETGVVAAPIDKAALKAKWDQIYNPSKFEEYYNSWTTGDIIQATGQPLTTAFPAGDWFQSAGVPHFSGVKPSYAPPVAPVMPTAPHPLGLNPEAKPVLEAFQKGEKSALDAITELGAKDYDIGDVEDALKKYAPDKAAEVDEATKSMMTPEPGAEAKAEIAGINKEWDANVDPLAEEFTKQNAVLYGLWEKEKMQLSGGFFLKMVKTLTKDMEDQSLSVRRHVAFARMLTQFTKEPDVLKKAYPKIYKWWGNTAATSEEAHAGSTVISEMPSALGTAKFEALPTGWDSQAELIKSSDYLQKSVANSRQWYDTWKLEGEGKTGWEKLFRPEEKAQLLAFYQQQGKNAEQAQYAVRGLAFAKSYVMAKAGMFKELDAVSPKMSRWWKDLLFPPPPTPLAKGKAPWAQWVDGRGYKQGNYSGLGRQIEDALKGHSEAQTRWYTLQRGVNGWKGGSQSAYHSAGEKMIKGLAPTNEYEKAAQIMWETIRDAAPDAPKLHRWIEHGGVKGDLNWWRSNIGKTVDMQLSGFSDPKGDYGHGRNVLYVLKPGSQSFWGMPISPGYASESEWWVGGRFKISNVEQGTGGRIDGVPGTVNRNTTVVYIDFVTPDRAGPSVLHER